MLTILFLPKCWISEPNQRLTFSKGTHMHKAESQTVVECATFFLEQVKTKRTNKRLA